MGQYTQAELKICYRQANQKRQFHQTLCCGTSPNKEPLGPNVCTLTEFVDLLRVIRVESEWLSIGLKALWLTLCRRRMEDLPQRERDEPPIFHL